MVKTASTIAFQDSKDLRNSSVLRQRPCRKNIHETQSVLMTVQPFTLKPVSTPGRGLGGKGRGRAGRKEGKWVRWRARGPPTATSNEVESGP